MHIKATAARSQLGLEAAQSHLVSEIICTKRSLLLKHTQHYSFPPVDQSQAPARPVGAGRAEQTLGVSPQHCCGCSTSSMGCGQGLVLGTEGKGTRGSV